MDTPASAPADGHVAAANARRWIELVFYGGQCALLVVLLFAYLRGWDRDFSVPLRFSRDSLSAGMLAKSTLDNGWWWFNPRVGAPFGLDERQYPADPNVDQAILWLVGRVIDDPWLAQNVAWLAMVVLSGLSATWCLRTLDASRLSALVSGTLFALTPYALYRSTGHLWLVIYLVPFACTAALRLAAGRVEPWYGGRPLAGLVAGCCLLAFNYVYYAFFACVLLLVATAIGGLQYRGRRALGAGMLLIALIGAGTVVNLVPNVRSWAERGQPWLVPQKTAAESEVYGLKIRQLVSPGLWHRFPPFRTWLAAEEAAAFPLENENGSTRLGAIATVGFLGLLGLLFAPRMVRSLASRDWLLAASRLTLAAILLSTVGGFGSLFNLLLTPEIRAYNRIAPFIAFFSLAAVAFAIDQLVRVPRARLAVAMAVGLLGLADQRAAAVHLNAIHQEVAVEFRSLRGMVSSLEAKLPPASLVFQLPVRMYPNDDGGPRAQPYENLKPYLASRSLRWSYPALSNQQVRWQQAAARLSIDRLPSELASARFAAILVDRDGYGDRGDQVIAELRETLGPASVMAETARYLAFDLRQVMPVPEPDSILAEAASANNATAGLEPCANPTYTDINRIGTVQGPFADNVATVARRRTLKISGWAVDAVGHTTAGGVDLVFDGNVLQTIHGLERRDVAEALQGREYLFSGFIGAVPARLVTSGRHMLAVRVRSADGGCCYVTSPTTVAAP